ncbi:MAG: hypothetical protein JSS02_15635 [Planctomycetes bacterium]|nr:hypothetical protein [Planctomycetota bacterium]
MLNRKLTACQFLVWAALCSTMVMMGCGAEAPAEKNTADGKSTAKKQKPVADEPESPPARETPKKKYQPVTLGNEPATANANPATASKTRAQPNEKRSQAIVTALQPFQLLLGQWRWITNKKFEGKNKSGEDLAWVWDFKHDPQQPALTSQSETHPYIRQLWFSFQPEENTFQVQVRPVEGPDREMQGTWTEDGEPREEADGKRVQHSYKLQLTQVTPAEGDQWQIVFSQLDNDQYLLTLSRKAASSKQFSQLDVVRQQRLGTSFAVADSDNPGPKCIISGGLGSMSVTYKGKSYPVCCSGCAAAFNDDPERWLAKLAERDKDKKPAE